MLTTSQKKYKKKHVICDKDCCISGPLFYDGIPGPEWDGTRGRLIDQKGICCARPEFAVHVPPYGRNGQCGNF